MNTLRSLAARCGGAGAVVGGLLVLCFVAIAVLAPVLAPFDPVRVDLANIMLPPDGQHWFGTDQAGRDVLSRVIWGSRASLTLSVFSTVIGVCGGVALGLVAGFFGGGVLEQMVMRFMDAMAAIPLLIWAIALVGVLGVDPIDIHGLVLSSETRLILLLGLLYMPGLSRVTHGAAQAEARAGYVAARRLQGVSEVRIMLGEVLPNCLAPVIVQATLLLAMGIIIEASVSFVGLGIQPPTPSWGNLLADAKDHLFSGEWWLSLFPGLAISAAVIGFNQLGDGLRDALDPRQTAPRSRGRLLA